VTEPVIPTSPPPAERNIILAALRPAAHRVPSGCATCGQFDDHPKHTVQHMDGVSVSKHFDCCALDGCPAPEADKSCGALLATANGKHGLELAAHLQTNPLGA